MNAIIIIILAAVFTGVNLYRILVLWRKENHMLHWDVQDEESGNIHIEVREEDLEGEGYIRALVNGEHCTLYVCPLHCTEPPKSWPVKKTDQRYLFMLCHIGTQSMLYLHGTVWVHGQPVTVSKALVWKTPVPVQAPVQL